MGPMVQHTSLALAYCHDHCVAHRDVKLDNILLNTTDDTTNALPCFKLCDFGVAVQKPAEEWALATLRDGVGSVLYAAPEIFACYDAMGEEDADVSYIGWPADVWSLGVCALVGSTGNQYMDVIRTV